MIKWAWKYGWPLVLLACGLRALRIDEGGILSKSVPIQIGENRVLVASIFLISGGLLALVIFLNDKRNKS